MSDVSSQSPLSSDKTVVPLRSRSNTGTFKRDAIPDIMKALEAQKCELINEAAAHRIKDDESDDIVIPEPVFFSENPIADHADSEFDANNVSLKRPSVIPAKGSVPAQSGAAVPAASTTESKSDQSSKSAVTSPRRPNLTISTKANNNLTESKKSCNPPGLEGLTTAQELMDTKIQEDELIKPQIVPGSPVFKSALSKPATKAASSLTQSEFKAFFPSPQINYKSFITEAAAVLHQSVTQQTQFINRLLYQNELVSSDSTQEKALTDAGYPFFSTLAMDNMNSAIYSCPIPDKPLRSSTHNHDSELINNDTPLYRWQCISSSTVKVRREPNPRALPVAELKALDIIEEFDRHGDWIRCNYGWVCIVSAAAASPLNSLAADAANAATATQLFRRLFAVNKNRNLNPGAQKYLEQQAAVIKNFELHSPSKMAAADLISTSLYGFAGAVSRNIYKLNPLYSCMIQAKRSDKKKFKQFYACFIPQQLQLFSKPTDNSPDIIIYIDAGEISPSSARVVNSSSGEQRVCVQFSPATNNKEKFGWQFSSPIEEKNDKDKFAQDNSLFYSALLAEQLCYILTQINNKEDEYVINFLRKTNLSEAAHSAKDATAYAVPFILRNRKISPQLLNVLCTMLSNSACQAVNTFELSHCELRSEAAELLVANISKNSKQSVQRIDLSYNPLTKGLINWVNITNLQELVLDSTKFDDEGCLSLANFMKAMQKPFSASLKSLVLSRNELSDKGFVPFFEALIKNKSLYNSLEMLAVNNNQLGNESAKLVGKFFAQARLIHLDMSSNKIADAGAAELARGLSESKTIQHFALSNNPISSTGATALTRVIPHAQQLLTYSFPAFNSEIDLNSALQYNSLRNNTLNAFDLSALHLLGKYGSVKG
jgi:hypothetical protein